MSQKDQIQYMFYYQFCFKQSLYNSNAHSSCALAGNHQRRGQTEKIKWVTMQPVEAKLKKTKLAAVFCQCHFEKFAWCPRRPASAEKALQRPNKSEIKTAQPACRCVEKRNSGTTARGFHLPWRRFVNALNTDANGKLAELSMISGQVSRLH